METFTCAHCGGTFKKTRSDEEALAETDAIFSPEEQAHGLAVLCDDCFKEFMRWLPANREN